MAAGETFFGEMKRYVGFGPEDEQALVKLAPHVRPHFTAITEDFYDRLILHDEARDVLGGPEQVERLKRSLRDWLELLFAGPWDEAYYQQRARIGRVHVKIALPQRYMFGAMNVIRRHLLTLAHEVLSDDVPGRVASVMALHRIIDLELAIMLESYREAFVDNVKQLERLEKILLERKLALSEARYEEVVEKGVALIITADTAGRIILFNRRCEEITHVSRDQAAGRNWLELFAGGADHAKLRLVWEDVRRGAHVAPYEAPVRSPDGRDRRVRWHFTTLPGMSAPVLCAIGIDVTEEHDLATRTRRAERLASLGTMAAGLAHEIRNPLNAAHLQLTVLKRRLARPEPDAGGAAEAADLAASEMKRLAALVDEFLQFARPQPLRLTSADLRATAQHTVALMSPEAAAAGVDLALAPGQAVTAECDDEKVKQVLLNLLRNAVEATGRGGRVRVAVAAKNGAVVVDVEDDGRGLPSPDAPIFEPFFTTKPNGTGLGLAIVHKIVADHGGRVDVESRPGRTVFSVVFPRVG